MNDQLLRERAGFTTAFSETGRLAGDDEFCFACFPGIPCFNHCCADVNIVLTPLDILRMSRRLGLSTSEFLARHTLVPFSAEQRLPFVFLKMREDERRTCPFVAEEGCTIYEDRPWPCRMYPVGQASPADENAQGGKFFFLVREDHCLGHCESKRWKVKEWIKDQAADEYEDSGEMFKQVLLHPYLTDHNLEPARMEMFYMAAYDLDKFRQFVFSSKFLARFVVEPAVVAAIKEDDLELMRFAFRWLRFALFGEMTMTINPRLLGERERELLKTRPH